MISRQFLGNFLGSRFLGAIGLTCCLLLSGCSSKEDEVVRILNRYWQSVEFDPVAYLESANPYSINPEAEFECQYSDYYMSAVSGTSYSGSFPIKELNVETQTVKFQNVVIEVMVAGGLLGGGIDDLKRLKCSISDGLIAEYSQVSGRFGPFDPESDVVVEKCELDGDSLDTKKLEEAFKNNKNQCED